MSRLYLQWLKFTSVTLYLSNIYRRNDWQLMVFKSRQWVNIMLEFINKITQETLDALDALTCQEEEILEQSELLTYILLVS